MISDCVSLSDKLTRRMRAFVPEHGAVDALLSAVINEPAPDKKSVRSHGSENDALSGANELRAFPAIFVMVAGVVSLVQCNAGNITIFRKPPQRL